MSCLFVDFYLFVCESMIFVHQTEEDLIGEFGQIQVLVLCHSKYLMDLIIMGYVFIFYNF